MYKITLFIMKKKIFFIRTIIVSADEVGQRIDNFLHTKLKGLPRSMIYRILRKGSVRVNKKRIKPKYKMVIGDKIRIPIIKKTDCTAYKEKIVSLHVKKVPMLSDCILYEDDYILGLNKPSGIAVHGINTLNFGIIEEMRILRPEIHFLKLVHRLDRDTSGVLLMAKKRSALLSLHEQLRKKEIQKYYLALVHGQWQSYIKVVEAPLIKNTLQKNGRLIQVNQNGKPSETRFQIIEEYYNLWTLLRCNPVTGRTHQIRVHTQYAGHPIVFDDRYGNRKFDRKLFHTGLSRLFLHASVLEFNHPNTGKTIRIEAPLDKQLEQCIRILRKEI